MTDLLFFNRSIFCPYQKLPMHIRTWLARHVLSRRRCQIPHSTPKNELIEMQVRYFFMVANGELASCIIWFLWGCVKAHVYTDESASIEALEDNIEAVIREIPVEILVRGSQNWTKHLRSTFAWNNLQVLNYMSGTINLCIFLNFMFFYFFKIVPISLKKYQIRNAVTKIVKIKTKKLKSYQKLPWLWQAL